MSVFADTSALYALLDRDDENHPKAAARWRGLIEAGVPVVTTNYVLVETVALVQHRLGVTAARALTSDIVPVLLIEWITPEDHRVAIAAMLAAGRRDLSLVDCANFAVMRRLGLEQALAFDRHFTREGFTLMS
jgi:predicted nucleic acid-binding protein